MAQAAKTIVLAEDDAVIARMYLTKLTRAGFRVIVCADGKQAYDELKTSQPDFVMMDLNMPELRGFEVIKALMDEGMAPPADRMIILTNSANPADRKLASQIGVDYIIKAEMTPRQIVNRINAKLGLPSH